MRESSAGCRLLATLSMSTKRRIHSVAPTRIDLAGGTVDIWPIYLFLKNSMTINVGIDLFAEAELIETDRDVVLASEDQKVEHRLTWDELEGASLPPGLLLHQKLLTYFSKEKKGLKKTGVILKTRARSPAGAGLGGSSALSIAMIGTLATWSRGKINPKKDGERFIEIVRDTETTVIQVPAGLQDYYGAMFGGLQALHWLPGVPERQSFPPKVLKELQKRLLLFYSGQSRNSGINNWVLFKSFIDKQGPVRGQFEQITRATLDLHAALKRGDWNAAAQAIAQEWSVRHELAKGISTPEIDQAFSIAMKAGAQAAKICGAGGGGCFFIYVPSGNAATMKAIQDQIMTQCQGIQPLPFRLVGHGLRVKVSKARAK